MVDHDDVTDSTSTVRPVCGSESTKCCVLTPTHVEEDRKKYLETRIGGSKRGARNWFQSTRTATCSCERSRTSPSSRACEKDRKSSSSRSTSCRLASTFHAAKIRKRWSANWAMWSNSTCATYTKSTMFSLSSLLESRNCVLHLRTMLDLQRIQEKVEQTEAGCTLYPELRDKERT